MKINKMILKQLISKFSIIYTMTCVAYSLGSCIDRMEVQPEQYLKIFGLIVGCGVITYVRVLLDRKQWMLRLSFMTKRIIFAPFYLALTIAVLLNFGSLFEHKAEDVIFICIVFAVTFLLSCIVLYPRVKREEEEFNRALMRYKKTMEEEEKYGH
ncbi:MAG: hypothetical protein PHR92_17590 [Lachnospiraceae bacterium]|nr:hypothetical protein [Lachnospiraceae bacterium]